MSEFLEDSNYKWELINRLINKKWQSDHSFFSFNINRKKEYSKKNIEDLTKEEGLEYSRFSKLVHQMPRSQKFNVSDDLLWEEYQNIFFCATIAKQKNDDLFKSDPDINKQWIKKYTQFEKEYELLEDQYIEALESNKSKTRIATLRNRLNDKQKDWVTNGHKKIIDEKRDQLNAEGEFSYASQWSKWKSSAENSWIADSKGSNSIIGSFTADFQSILDGTWHEEIFSYKQLKTVISDFQNKEDDIGIKQLVNEVDRIKFKYMKVSIERDWFFKDVFTSPFWKWKPSYHGQWLSDGNLNGSIPSYIKEVIFLKEICFRERSNAVLDLVEWVGGGFKELNYIPFIENKKKSIFLNVFICEKTPKCPLPNPKLTFNKGGQNE